MGREVRRVPPGWNHPRDERGNFRALFDGANLTRRTDEWDRDAALWKRGLRLNYGDEDPTPVDPEWIGRPYAEWAGDRPDPDDYTPVWAADVATHLMMYENTSEGTPISPAFATAEELARWLAATAASAFGGMTATYDEWLATIKRGSACSAVYSHETGLVSGVQALAAETPDGQ